jgi:hypothetical protein
VGGVVGAGEGAGVVVGAGTVVDGDITGRVVGTVATGGAGFEAVVDPAPGEAVPGEPGGS